MDTDLEAILALTDRVQKAIDAGEWQHAHELETERRLRLERLLGEHRDGVGLLDALTQLERRNHGLIGLVEHHKRRVLREAATVKTRHAGAAAYAEARASR